MATFDEEGKGQKSQSLNTHANMRSIYKGNREREKSNVRINLTSREMVFKGQFSVIRPDIETFVP